MAGHNKWSKIKHKKAVTDAAKSKIFSKHAALIAMESRKAGGDVNSPGLAAAIERAKKDSMPKDNIERAVAKGKGGEGGSLEEVMYEGYGPGGVAVLVQVVTDNTNRTAAEVRHTFSKSGLDMGTPGSASWAFTKNAENQFVPNTPMELDDATGEKLAEFIEKLEDLDDVTDVFTAADTLEEQV
ncbi:MAG: YebC/PmpR family DNA-binding transcriptional regulator [Patescibacteria group bacterium]